MGDVLKVFCSYTTSDREPVVEARHRLADAGIEPLVDIWEIRFGDPIVQRVDEMIQRCDAGLIFVSKEALASNWVCGEMEALVKQSIERGKRVLAVRLESDIVLPPLLDRYKAADYSDFKAVIDDLLGHTGKPQVAEARKIPRICSKLAVRIRPLEGEKVGVQAFFQDEPVAEEHSAEPGVGFHFSYADFLADRFPLSRETGGESQSARQAALVKLGDNLGRILFPGESGNAVSDVIERELKRHCKILLEWQSEDHSILSWPFEAAILPGKTRPLALKAGLRQARRLLGESAAFEPPAGPLRILVAVGAPDEDQTQSNPLDLERELQTILDALEEAQGGKQALAEILEVGHPDEIRKALLRQHFHVLHISGHGLPGRIEMEDEEGRPVAMTPQDLSDAVRQAGRTPPLVFLATCHSGRGEKDVLGFAQDLLTKGFPMVVAMQATVSDWYATRLAGGLYGHLKELDPPSVSHALMLARQEVEATSSQLRQESAQSAEKHRSEYAVASLFLAGEERPLLDTALPAVELKSPKRRLRSGTVPLLEIGELVGRRAELRRSLKLLRQSREHSGIQILGIGGVGKSALAGRIMQLLHDQNPPWTVVSISGRLDAEKLASNLRRQLKGDDFEELREGLAEDAQDQQREDALKSLLAYHRVLLVLDNLEDNLRVDTRSWVDPVVAQVLEWLSQNARDRKLLITCRYPLPNFEGYLERINLPPLSPGQARKLLWRLQALEELEPDQRRLVLKTIGGHPRMLEYLDALLRKGQARLTFINARLREIADQARIDLSDPQRDLESALEEVIRLGVADVLLDELLDLAGADLDLLEQASVFTSPIEARGLAYTRAWPSQESPVVEASFERSLQRLQDLSLLHWAEPGGVFVHRWTFQGIRQKMSRPKWIECSRRAGECRMWRVRNTSHSISDGMEAVRHFLHAECFDQAASVALAIVESLRGYGRASQRLEVLCEVRRSLPREHDSFPLIGIHLGDVLVQFGRFEDGLNCYSESNSSLSRLANSEPQSLELQRALSTSWERLGDMRLIKSEAYSALACFQEAVKIRRRIASQESDRAYFHRELSVVYNKLGDLHRALGEGQSAREYYEKDLEIAARLAGQEPDRSDYQRDLSVSYNKLGDLHRALGEGQSAREYYEKALEIAARLADQEPDRSDYQRDLSVSYNKLGDLHRALGEGQSAREYYEKALEIAARLAGQEPDRSDLQVDLVLSLVRISMFAKDPGVPLRAALAILEELHQQNRLSPDRVGLIDAVRKMIGELEEGSQETGS